MITRREQELFNLEIKKKSGSSINPDMHHSKVPSSDGRSIEITATVPLISNTWNSDMKHIKFEKGYHFVANPKM